MNSNIITPKLSLYHANPKGTGSAIQFELRPAHGFEEGAIYFRIAPQATVGSAANKVFPTFDWEKAIVGKLCFTDVCQMLQVFRGECETINDGKGLFQVSTKDTKVIRLAHVIDPVGCYMLDVTKTDKDADGHPVENETRVRFSFSCAEALGLCEVFAGSLKEIAFGTSFEATSIAIARDDELAKMQEKTKETAPAK